MASPTRTLAKRAELSRYPVERGEECENEFQYLNFDMEDEKDEENVEKIRDTFCNDLPVLLKDGFKASTESNKVFLRYFNSGDEGEVKSLLGMLWDGNKIQPLVKSFIIDKNTSRISARTTTPIQEKMMMATSSKRFISANLH